jgi:hypothetical protein
VFNLLDKTTDYIIFNFFIMPKGAKVGNKTESRMKFQSLRCEKLPDNVVRMFALTQVDDRGGCFRIARNFGYLAERNWAGAHLVPWEEIPPKLMYTALLYRFEPFETCCFYSPPPNIVVDKTTNIFVCTQFSMEQEYAFIPRVQGEVSWIPNDRRCQITLPTSSFDTHSPRTTKSGYNNAADSVCTQNNVMGTSAVITVPDTKPNRKRMVNDDDKKKSESVHNPILCTYAENTNEPASIGTQNDVTLTAVMTAPEIKPKRKRVRKEQGADKKVIREKSPTSCTDPDSQTGCTLPLLHPRTVTVSVAPLVGAVQLGVCSEANVVAVNAHVSENKRLVACDKKPHPDPDETDISSDDQY